MTYSPDEASCDAAVASRLRTRREQHRLNAIRAAQAQAQARETLPLVKMIRTPWYTDLHGNPTRQIWAAEDS